MCWLSLVVLLGALVSLGESLQVKGEPPVVFQPVGVLSEEHG